MRTRSLSLSTCAALVALSATPAAGAQAGLRKGPWLMDPRATEITVMVERETSGPVTVSAVPESGADATVAGAVSVESAALIALHEVTLRGLRPGTRYRYTVTGPSIEEAEGRFATAPEGEGFVPFRFVVYGDTRSRASAHRAVINALVSEGAEWAMHTGDLLDDGRDEEQWQGFFEIERALLRSTPMIPVIGNHEIARPGSSGVDLYRRYVRCAPSAASPQPELHYTFAWGNVHAVLVNGYDDFTDERTAGWLEAQLAAARAAADRGRGWVLFVSHWGPRSSGPHGENRPFLRGNIADLLRRHRVDLSIAGHDHLYERGDDQGLRYLVSGGGGSPLYRRRFEREYARTLVSAHHYVRVDVESDRLLVSALAPDGALIERCGLRHTGWDCDGPTRTPQAPSAQGSISPGPSAVNDAVQRNCSCRVPVGSMPHRAEIARWGALACALWVGRRRRETARS
ncbi:MAG: metallophosphoesterase family protein [Polyangiales bacterium]